MAVIASYPSEFVDASVFDSDFEIERKAVRREPASVRRFLGVVVHGMEAVSYTHLDVYKRQI